VETEEQRAALLRLGCRSGQGYLLAPPMTADEVTRLLVRAGLRVTWLDSREPVA